MDLPAVDGPIIFNRDVRKDVFEFFASVLRNYTDPVYYEYIRGHVSKASIPIRKYVVSKCKGEKLLEYFKLRKNYFIVEGTDVQLIKDHRNLDPKRKRYLAECIYKEVIRSRKQYFSSDRASCKRSFSCSSADGDNTVTSSRVSRIDTREKLVHEDYVNKFFWDLVVRNEKVDLLSLEFDNLPKKVKRHLDLYFRRKVSNYFAQFPDKYKIDDDFKVSLNLGLLEDSCVASETKSAVAITPPNSATDNSPLIPPEKKATANFHLIPPKKKEIDPNDQEIQNVLFHTDAILFFIGILTKKKTAVTVQQLGGYLSQAPNELRSFFKLNYKSFKDFFEETSYIFSLNIREEVTLSKFVRYHKAGVKRIGKIAMKASIGEISLQTMREKVDELRTKIKTLFSDNESDKNTESSCEVIDTVQQITENQPEPLTSCKTIEVGSGEPKCLSENINGQIDELKTKIQTFLSNKSDKNTESSCEVIAEALKRNDAVQQISQSQPEPLASCKTVEVGSDEPKCLDKNINEQIETFEINELRTKIQTFSSNESDKNTERSCKVIAEALPHKDTVQQFKDNQPEPFEIEIYSETEIDVPIMIERLKIDFEYKGYSTNGIVFEINGKLYEPNGKIFEANSYEIDLSSNDTIDEDITKTIIKVIPHPCEEHSKCHISSSESNIDANSYIDCPSETFDEEKCVISSCESNIDANSYIDCPSETFDEEKRVISSSEGIIDANSYIDCPSETFDEEKTFKFLLMIELICLEMTENDFDFTVSHEVKAIQYFIKVLDQPNLKSWSASSLHGTLGKASAEVSSFINKKYSIRNFLSFFQKQPEFEVYPPIIKLSTSYKEAFARRIRALSVSIKRNSKWDLIKLYESDCYKTNLTEIFSLFCEICKFLKNKIKTKVSRLEGIVTRFPNSLDWIKSLEGETVAKKARNFLHLCDIFEFPSDDYISFQKNYFNDILIMWFQNTHQYFDCPNNHIDLVSIFLDLRNQAALSPLTKKFEVEVELSCSFIKEAIKDKLPLKYHELSRNLPEHLLQEIIESGIGSRSLIEALLKDGQYFLQNGKIDLKTDENSCMVLYSAVDNLLVTNQEIQSYEEATNMSEGAALETSNGSLSNNQSSGKTSPDYYNDNENTPSLDIPFVSSINENILCESTPSNILSSVNQQNDWNDCNQNEFQMLDSKCTNHNSENTVSKEIELNNCEQNEFQLLDSECVNHNSESAVSKEIDLNDCNQNEFQLLDSEYAYHNSESAVSKEIKEIVSIGCKENFKNASSYQDTDQIDSATSDDEIDSLIALGERYSLSRYENEEFYSDEEGSHDSIEQEANKCVANTRYKKDISSQFEDKPETGNIDITMKKYLELLEMDDEVLDTKSEIATEQKNTSSDGNALSEVLNEPEVLFASNLNDCKTKIELPDEPKVTDILNNVNNQTEEIKKIASIVCKEDFKNSSFYKDSDQTDSTASVKVCIEKFNEDTIEKNPDSSFDVVKCKTCNQVSHHNKIECEDFDSSVEEINSLIALGERYSLSSYENEEFYSDEEGSHDSIQQEANKCVADTRYKKDISSQFEDKPETGNIDVTTEKYLELLKMDDEVLDTQSEIDTEQKDTSSDGNALSEVLNVPNVLFASNLNDCKTKIELPDEPKVTNILKKFNYQTDFIKNIENKYISENLSEMKTKAELLAKEFLKDKFHEVVRSQIFVASTKILFEFSLPNVKPNADKDFNHVKDISFKDNSQDKYVSMNNDTANTQFNLNNGKDIFAERPLQGDLNSTKDKEKSASFSSSNGNECHVPNKYPLQPISAEIMLLTSDSCIAVADIDSRKQNIYFLKCVFVCDDQYCCSNCFNDLKVGDIVSCFVPPTEISRKMWIAFMVSKEAGDHFNEIDSFNEVFAKQSKGGDMHHNMCVNSKNVLIQTEHSSTEIGCQVECKSTEKTSQTHLSGDVKLCTITKDSACQINPLVKSASIQTVTEVNSSECQTEIIDKMDIESQTNHTGKLKEISTCAEMSCQTLLSGEVRPIINVVETECQTISTGQVMITKYYHL